VPRYYLFVLRVRTLLVDFVGEIPQSAESRGHGRHQCHWHTMTVLLGALSRTGHTSDTTPPGRRQPGPLPVPPTRTHLH
jgi:hypothetical protein